MGKQQNKGNAAVFVDRDGTVIKERFYLSRIKDVELYKRAVPALRLLKNAGFKLILITNQSGVGRGFVTEKKLKEIHAFLQNKLKEKGVAFDAVYYCPHTPEQHCNCRKPNLGLVNLAKKRFKIDLKRSYSIGDHKRDFLLGRKMGGKGVFIMTGHGRQELRDILKDRSIPRPHRIEKNIYHAAKWVLTDSSR